MSVEYDLIINIGLDFGSSTTKVCYRLQGNRIDKKSAVIFSGRSVSPDGLLRDSEIYVSEDLKYMGWKKFPGCKTVRFLKTYLINNHQDTEKCKTIKAMCAYYLASIFTLSKQYIERVEAELLKKQRVLWVINIGLPVDQDEPGLETAYKEIVNVAVLRCDEAFLYPHISLEHWKSFYEQSRGQSPTDIIIYLTPELLAEVIDVFEDPEVGEGISMIIDIGSATVDIAIVELDRHSSAESYLVNFICAKVAALGVDNTIKYISAKRNDLPDLYLKKALFNKSDCGQVYNLLKDISSEVKGLEKYGESLLDKFHGLLAHICLNAKNSSMGNKLQLMENIPLYILGGGSYYYWYNYWPREVFNKTLFKCNIPKFCSQKLYHQPNIAMLDKKYYQRFRVASGLTTTETMLRINGYPWHFDSIDHPLCPTIPLQDRLEEIRKEKYGN